MQYGQVILTGLDPKSRRGGWYPEVCTAPCGAAVDAATAAVEEEAPAAGSNSVTVTCRPLCCMMMNHK